MSPFKKLYCICAHPENMHDEEGCHEIDTIAFDTPHSKQIPCRCDKFKEEEQ